MVLLAAAMLVFTFPVFDVALGLAILGTIGGPALTEWRTEKRLRKSTPAQDDENKDRD